MKHGMKVLVVLVFVVLLLLIYQTFFVIPKAIEKTNLKFEILGCFDPIKKITDTVKESIASGSPVMALFCLGMHESIAADTVNELLMDSNIVVSFEYWTPGEPGELDSYLDITNDRITCLLKDAIVAFEPYCEPDGAGYSCRIKFGVTWSDDFY